MLNFPSQCKGLRVLVTGADGMIGAHTVQFLLDQGAQVTALVHHLKQIKRLPVGVNGLTIYEADFEQVNALILNEIIQTKIDVVIHLAAYGISPANRDIATMMKVNVQGTYEVLQWAKINEVRRFVYCGSCFEYAQGDGCQESDMPAPISEYGVSKTAGWFLSHQAMRVSQLPVVSLRPFTVYGPGEEDYRLIGSLMRHAIQNKDIALTMGKQKRDFVFVADVAQAFARAAVCPGIEGQTFNVCTGESKSVREIVEMILNLSKSTAKPLFGQLPYRANEMWALSGSPNKAHELLGFQAKTTLQQGLAQTLEWFRQWTT